ncbi:TetR/AcrR family transcriptional regulator [Stakelama sp. CBK3Z-3]|uniref:TetR/AcrR family transcriptional regulator n=1 Tax=Stakelama flava TaxID=2860338 RepID=A0ABS6XNK2_9SPHN|nr:TetR/AcrR family transcriptional regulator [Stakelama flava]
MPKASRKPRADALRNRERLLDAAKRVFAGGASDASLDAVAREAGVGIATLYRHFPTREALYEAVYRREVDELVALADGLAGVPDSVAGLRRWLRAMIDLVATKKGMVAALAISVDAKSAVSARMSKRLAGALGALLDRAIAEKRIRRDVSGEEMLLALVGMCILRDQPDWREGAVKMADVLVDGMMVKK